MLFDVNAYLGYWPFALDSERSASGLVASHARAGIGRAAVSPLGAVFQPEPMPANRRLVKATRSIDQLVPVPVINPMLATWREHLSECRAMEGICAVRVMPSYHGYDLGAKNLADFMDVLRESGLRLVVTARLEDERQQFHALRIRGIGVATLQRFLGRFSEHHVLVTGLPLTQIVALAETHVNFSADLSYSEHIALGSVLRGKIDSRRLMFGTFAPLVSARAQTAKILNGEFTTSEQQRIGTTNAQAFFYS